MMMRETVKKSQILLGGKVKSISLIWYAQVMDIPNKISKRGLIYFPDFCQLVLEKFRGDAVEEEIFRQNMFKVLINDDGNCIKKWIDPPLSR